MNLCEVESEIQRLQALRHDFIATQLPSKAETQRAYKEQLIQLGAVLRRYDITLPETRLTMQANWRCLVPELYGSIVGLPTCTGKLICTNGVLAIMVRQDHTWGDVHIQHFEPVSQQDLSQLHELTRQRKHKPQPTAEELILQLVNIV